MCTMGNREEALICLYRMPSSRAIPASEMGSAKAVLKAGVNGITMPSSNGDYGSGKPDRLTNDEHAVLSLRNLLFDIIMQNGGGHGGSAIGMAAIGVALYKHTMRFNPSNPAWFDRDRFILSNGTYSRSTPEESSLTAIRSCRNVPIRS